MNADSLKLYAITDRSWLKENETLADAVENAILGGATIVQLREKELAYDELKKLALLVQEVCRKYKVPFIINDNVELAKEIDADGVHVGLSDAAVSEAKKILGPGKIVGATAKTIEQALAAERDGADYLGSGAVFGSTTKLDAKPMTMELLSSICTSVNIPVVAIGGIDETNIEKLKNIPIAGAAVVSGIFAKSNERRAASRLWDILYGRKVIHCITNVVTVNHVADVILAVGGSPIMAHHPKEVEEVQRLASALLVNLGATDDYDAIKIAYKTALELKHPIIIDPVGVGGIKFRREFLKELLTIGSPTVIRGNFGEIKAILNDETTMVGLDSDELSDKDLVWKLARKTGCIVVASGKQDIIADQNQVIVVETGTHLQKEVTGSGCMLSAVVGTLMSYASEPSIFRAVNACELMGDTAMLAAQQATGSMNFFMKWMDLISTC